MTDRRGQALISAVYPLALLLMLTPVVNIALTIWPPRFGETTWRFGAFGLLMEAMVFPVLGLALAAFGAYFLEHRKTLRSIAIVDYTVALVFLVGAALFLLDAVQMRARVQPDARIRFDVAAVRAVATALFGATILVWLGVGAWKSSHGETARERVTSRSANRLMHRAPRPAAEKPMPVQ